MRKLVISAGTLALLTTAGQAAAIDFGLGVKLGTLGAGLEGTLGITEKTNIRFAYNGASYSDSGTDGDVPYDYDLEWSSFGATVDYHPFGGGFRLSAGAFQNGNELQGSASQDQYEIGGSTYNVGLDSSIDFDDVAPYFGIGWGNAVGKDGRFSFAADVGVLMQGSPYVSLVANGDPAVINDPTFQQDLQREEQELEDDLSEFELYPVISVGVTYRF